MNYELLKDIILNNQRFIISAHVNPDADAIGSELALYHVLKKLNKDVRVINHSVTPYNLLFLDKDKAIEKFDADKHDEIFKNADVLFALDLNRSNRLVSVEKYFLESKGLKICIDHHQDKGDFADHFFIDTELSATGELIYDFIHESKIVEFDYDIALQIYAAIMTDTGSFKYDRTTPKVHRIAAHLLELGINPTYVFDQLYDQSKFGKIKLLGKALDSLTLSSSGKVGFMTITQKMLNETGAIEADVDGFVNFCLAVENVEIGLLFFELRDGIKISFRSKGNIPVNKLAAEFNGGGHTNAAGTRLFHKTIADLLNEVLLKAENYIKGENKDVQS